MPYIIFLALVIVIATLPVMFAARMVNAGRTGFGTALLAVFLLKK